MIRPSIQERNDILVMLLQVEDYSKMKCRYNPKRNGQLS